MAYIVVVGYDSTNKLCKCVEVDETNFNLVRPLGTIAVAELGVLTVRNGYKPLNYGVDRLGAVKEECGSFSRFADKGSAVVLAELKTKGGRTLGYRLLSCSTLQVVNLKTDEIIAIAKKQDNPFLQNGIIRNNTVNCYPMHKFPSRQLTQSAQNKTKKPQETVTKQVQSPAQVKKFDEKQNEEIAKCKAAGINPKLLNNADLSKEQMRVLWVSKKNGALAEYYANPNLSVDAMKFYADRVVSKEMAKDCEELLKHPELSVDELKELYLCICDDIPVSDLIGKSAEDILIEREKKTREYWGTSKIFDEEYYDKAISVARRMRGF